MNHAPAITPPSALQGLLLQRIAKGGPIPFTAFMQAALYEPGLGYYTHPASATDAPLTGATGDYFTSVSVGKLFGECLARQIAEMWRTAGSPSHFWLLEQGARDGRLAMDVLAGLQAEDTACHSAAHLILVEYFADDDAQARLSAAIAPLSNNQVALANASHFPGSAGLPDPQWLTAQLDAWEISDPQPFGILYSNELLDAFPVALIRRCGNQWLELHVAAAETNTSPASDAQAFRFIPLPPATPGLAEAIADLDQQAQLPDIEGYTTEVNLLAPVWMRAAARLLKRGYILTIDYGLPRRLLYSPGRTEGTLRCFRRHTRPANPLQTPGLQDITSDVDFTALALAGGDPDPGQLPLHVLGLVDQQRFLMGNAPPLLSADSPLYPDGNLPPDLVRSPGYRALLRAWQALTHPEHLGSKFHILLQCKGMHTPNATPPTLRGLRFCRHVEL